MNDCTELELLVSLRASGASDALDRDEAARLDAHLATCAACRAELEGSSAALSLARLPPPSAAERAAVRDLPARTLEALHHADARRLRSRRWLAGAAGVAIAAGLAAVIVAPALFEKTPDVALTFAEDPREWQAPDLDGLWADAQVVDFETSVQADGDVAEAALAALDF